MRRIAVAATAPFGADVLERLAAGPRRRAAPDAAGQAPRPRPQARADAGERRSRSGSAIPVAQPARLGEDVEIPVDTVVVAAYGLLIPETLLDRALWLNVHPSLLPRWRGAAPVERALMAGDTRTGVTIHRTTPELDAGPIAAQEAFDVGPEDDAGAVFARSAEIAARLIGDVLAGAAVHAAARRRRHLRGEDHARGPQPRPRRARRASTSTASARCRRTSVRARSSTGARSSSGRRASATTARFELLEVQPEGGRRMPYDAYLRGRR